MNNQREIYEALLAGETLINTETGNMKIVMDVNGYIKYSDGSPCDINELMTPDVWQIYKEPKWYENIPEGGVLCLTEYGVRKITAYDGVIYYVGDRINRYEKADPLTKQEIQLFLSNAPGGT